MKQNTTERITPITSPKTTPNAAQEASLHTSSPAVSPMRSMPVPALLRSMGLPMMLSMLCPALYNVVDTFYVSRIPDSAGIAHAGEKAIQALTLAFPVQMILMALGVGTGVGINALVAHCLGRKEQREAEHAAGNALFMSLLYFAVMFLFGLFGAAPFIRSQTSNPVVLLMGIRYVRIISVFSLGTLAYMCLEKITVATGRTRITMVTQLAGALTNIFLDPVMIYGWFGLPAMGVTGAAVATVIGQFVSLIWLGRYYIGRHRILQIHPEDLIPRRHVLHTIYRTGLPAIAMQILVPIMSYGMNLILGSISEAAVTTYGIYYKLQNFIFMPAYGLNNASIPITAYNRGACDFGRILQAIRWALIYVTGIMAAGVFLFEGFTRPIVGIFAVSGATEQLCLVALRIISWGFFFSGVNIILQGVCQALGNGIASLVISLIRLLLVPLSTAAALSRLAGAAQLVWLSVPAGEITAAVVAVILTRRQYRREQSAE